MKANGLILYVSVGVVSLVVGCALFGQREKTEDRTPPVSSSPSESLWDKAMALHRRAIVVDTHSDTTSRMLDEGFDFGPHASTGHMDLVRMKEGGLDAEFFSIYVAAQYAGKGAAKRALAMMDALAKQVAKYPDQVELANSVADIRRLKSEDKIAALMGLEGGHAIEDDLDVLRKFYRMGIRYVTLTHSNTNNFADSSGDEPRWGGLNELGRQIVKEMNRLGVIVDISHVSDETFWDVLEVSEAPVMASHSSCRALVPIPRNMTDQMIKALAKKGGVVMINFGSDFVNAGQGQRSNKVVEIIRQKYRGDFSHWNEVRQKLDKEGPPLPPATLDDIVAHIEHIVKLVGPDYVGFGSDFDGVPNLPEGLADCTKLPSITYELLKRGYSEQDVTKILGGNLLRVFEAVEQTAARLQGRSP